MLVGIMYNNSKRRYLVAEAYNITPVVISANSF